MATQLFQSYWYENTETSWYGLNVNLGTGKLELTGTPIWKSVGSM